MEKDFTKHQLKPGDDGFQYDKRITFEKDNEPLEDDSWGEESDDEDQEVAAKNNNNVAAAQQ